MKEYATLRFLISSLLQRLVPGGMCQNIHDHAKRMQTNFGHCSTEKLSLFWVKFHGFSAKIENRFGEPCENSRASPKFANLRTIFRSDFV